MIQKWLNILEFPRKPKFKRSFVLLFSCIRLCATPWSAACQVSLSFTISQSLLKLMSIELVMLSNHLSSCPQSFPASGSFPVSQLFTSDSQSIGASTSASVLPVNSQGWFPLGLTGLILLSKGLSSLLQHHSLKASIILLCCPTTKMPVWGAVTLTLDQKIALYVHPTRNGIISPPVSFALPIPGVWETQLFFFFLKVFIYFFGGSSQIRDWTHVSCIGRWILYHWTTWASLVAQTVKNPPAIWDTWVRPLGWEDPLEEGMATHSSILAWRIPMDREAWRATVHGVAKSWTGLKRLSTAQSHLESLLLLL